VRARFLATFMQTDARKIVSRTRSKSQRFESSCESSDDDDVFDYSANFVAHMRDESDEDRDASYEGDDGIGAPV